MPCVQVDEFIGLVFMKQAAFHSWLCGEWKRPGFGTDSIREEFVEYRRLCDEASPCGNQGLGSLGEEDMSCLREMSGLLADFAARVHEGLSAGNGKVVKAARKIKKILMDNAILLSALEVSNPRRCGAVIKKLKGQILRPYVELLGAWDCVCSMERVGVDLRKRMRQNSKSANGWNKNKGEYVTRCGKFSKEFVKGAREVNRFAPPERDAGYVKFVGEVNDKIGKLAA
jgi:hypothetical protein